MRGTPIPDCTHLRVGLTDLELVIDKPEWIPLTWENPDVWQRALPRMGPTSALLAFDLLGYAVNNPHGIDVDISSIAYHLGVSSSRVIQSVIRLESFHWLLVKRVENGTPSVMCGPRVPVPRPRARTT